MLVNQSSTDLPTKRRRGRREQGNASDRTHHEAIARFGKWGVIDMMKTAGYFCFVSPVLNMERHPVPEDAVNAAGAEDPAELTRGHQ